MPPKRKYRNQPQQEDGYKFASKRELARYRELKLMEKAGEITLLEVHPRYVIEVNGQRICTYTADFRYLDSERGNHEVVEDVKGMITRDFKLRKKLMLAVHGIDVQVVK